MKNLMVLLLFTMISTLCLGQSSDKMIVLTTWPNVAANEGAHTVLENGGSALDAVEAGVRIKEADADDTSVGLGGYPDETGTVTLDACIMDAKGNAGSVTFLEGILHPISVARKVMEETNHVILSGKGALKFAQEQGFEETNLLTERAKNGWEEWKKNKNAKKDNHDTIGMLAVDQDGNISGGCSTSGLAFKMQGRVGDSPIIGAGLFVDNQIGGAAATGVGEEVLRTLGSFLVVELMRNGASPQEACEEAVRRIVSRYENPKFTDFHVGFIALDKEGRVGAYSVAPGLEYTLTKGGETTVNKAFSHSK